MSRAQKFKSVSIHKINFEFFVLAFYNNGKSNEKAFITLGFSGFGTDSQTVDALERDLERIMTAWVVCDDLESHRASFGTIIDSSSIEGKLRGSLSENP